MTCSPRTSKPCSGALVCSRAARALDAIETVCSDEVFDQAQVLDVLGSLVDKSLVVSGTDATTGQMRFHLLETVREYAMEELVAASEAEATFDRHLAWCTELAERGWHEIWGAEMRSWLDLLDREHDNLRLAIDHAAGAGDLMLGLRTAHSLWPMWDIRGHYREGQRRLRLLLDLADESPSTAKGRALDALGWLTALLGDFPTAYELMQEGSRDRPPDRRALRHRLVTRRTGERRVQPRSRGGGPSAVLREPGHRRGPR